MGITRMGDLKHTKSGARSVAWRNKRNHAIGRPAAETRIGAQRIHPMRTRGGNLKHRALRLDVGTFAWASENATRRARIVRVVWHPSDNEFVRTNTLTKGSIVEIESTAFRLWYERQYGRAIGRTAYQRPPAVSDKVTARWAKLDGEPAPAAALVSQFDQGRVLAAIASRPGQCGRADGYILEGEELEFYSKRVSKKGKK
jgi:small subunit ribosomal protein S8e